jgi:hypothetical protein
MSAVLIAIAGPTKNKNRLGVFVLNSSKIILNRRQRGCKTPPYLPLLGHTVLKPSGNLALQVLSTWPSASLLQIHNNNDALSIIATIHFLKISLFKLFLLFLIQWDSRHAYFFTILLSTFKNSPR